MEELAADSMSYAWQCKRFGKTYVDAYSAGVMAHRAGLGINCSLADKQYAEAFCDGYADAKDGKEW